MEWQSHAALGIVAITLGMFIMRIFFRRKSKSACGHHCDCGAKKNPK